jgi:hypothetical protein
MDIGSIFLLLGIFLLVAVYVGQPLLRKNADVVSSEEQEYSTLLAERDRILNALQELDFDYALGKIPENIYPSERAALLQRGAGILQKIDVYEGVKLEDEISARLEAAVENRIPDAKNKTSSKPEDDELEAMIAQRLRNRKGKSVGFCPQCGHAVQQADRFCSKCGNDIV